MLPPGAATKPVVKETRAARVGGEENARPDERRRKQDKELETLPYPPCLPTKKIPFPRAPTPMPKPGCIHLSPVQPPAVQLTTPMPPMPHPLQPKKLFSGEKDTEITTNPLYCSIYANEIFIYLQKIEVTVLTKSKFWSCQLTPFDCPLCKL